MSDRDRIFRLANLNDHGQEISHALDRLEKRFADERERCAEVCRRKRMLLEAYCDPGRSREPLSREQYVHTIAYLWECERDILGREPEEHKPAVPIT